MPRVSAYPMVQVSEALEAILARAQPLGRETVDLLHARGRILAQDILADADLPGLPRSSVDGYAVIAGDDSAEFEVLEEVTAGRLAHAQLRKGTAVYIMTRRAPCRWRPTRWSWSRRWSRRTVARFSTTVRGGARMCIPRGWI